MEESTFHEMVIYLSQRSSGLLWFFRVFFHLIISFDAERMIVKTREM